ncbi:MAG: hypothetical protein ACRD3M_16105 [Thermoanaerobaculia bacterium]
MRAKALDAVKKGANAYRGPGHVDRKVRFDTKLDSAMVKLAKMEHMSFNHAVRIACWNELRRRNLLTLAS